MKASDLVTVWSAPDNSRLTPKQFSFRLPTHVAAKLAALEEMFPGRSRTQLVGDLLASALSEAADALPAIDGRPLGEDPDTGEKIHEMVGPRARFFELAEKHFKAIEEDLGNETPGPLPR